MVKTDSIWVGVEGCGEGSPDRATGIPPPWCISTHHRKEDWSLAPPPLLSTCLRSLGAPQVFSSLVEETPRKLPGHAACTVRWLSGCLLARRGLSTSAYVRLSTVLLARLGLSFLSVLSRDERERKTREHAVEEKKKTKHLHTTPKDRRATDRQTAEDQERKKEGSVEKFP